MTRLLINGQDVEVMVYGEDIHNNVTVSAPVPFHGIGQSRGDLNGGEGEGEIYG
jgi:hypothetical protein